jgi:hypothetical protein
MERKNPVEKCVSTLLAGLDHLIAERDKKVLAPYQQNEFYILVLQQIGVFLREVGSHAHQRLFYDLARSVADSWDGAKVPFLTSPSAYRHDTSLTWAARAQAAAGINALLRNKMTRKEAATYASTKFPELERLSGKKSKDLKTAILAWYDELADRRTERRTKSKAAINSYQVAVKELNKISDKDYLRFADVMFQRAAVEARRI